MLKHGVIGTMVLFAFPKSRVGILVSAYRQKPWNLDHLSGVALSAFALFLLADPDSVANRDAYAFLEPFNIRVAACIFGLVGLTQIVATEVNHIKARKIVSAIVLWKWLAIGFGMHNFDPTTPSIVFPAVMAYGNFIILSRA